MNSLWRLIINALGRRPDRSADAPDAAVAAPRAGNVPPGSFDRRPVVRRNTSHGVFCLPADATGDAAARAISDGVPVAAELLEVAQKHVVPGSIVIDVGAGFGRMSALFSGLTGVAGQVMAFEADDYLCDLLQESILLNRCENVRVFHGVVYDMLTLVSLPQGSVLPGAVYGGRRVDASAGGETMLKTRTIDQLKIDAPVSFLYIDTNGCELQVLRGAVETIRRLRMAVAFRFQPQLAQAFGTTSETLQAFFEPLDYRLEIDAARHLCCALPREYPASLSSRTGPQVGAAPAYANIQTPPHDLHLCKILRNHTQIRDGTRYLKEWGYVPHHAECKDWDLAHFLPAIGDGHCLDMGSSDSYILKNLALKRIRGELHGIDLRAPDMPVSNVNYRVGDLMRTPYPDGHFANITCLSVLEHQVDYDRFAAETSRLLAPGGRVFVTFDYWEPKVTPPVQLYGLDWMPLDAAMVTRFIASCARHGLEPIEPFDFTAGDALIRGDYFSPHPDVSYTFGMAVFRKH